MTTDQEKAFDKYTAMLRDWNTRMNLVARGTLDNVRTRHIDDSVQLAGFIPRTATIVDLGSGAGFPAVVLAILGYNVTAIESIGKKTGFLGAVKRELGLDTLTIYHGRVEDFIQKNRQKTGFLPIYTARAFASLVKIFDLTYPIKGRYFLLKGRKVDDEVTEASARYTFTHRTSPSATGDGFILEIDNLKQK